MSEFSTPAGWYPDGNGWERRWDGSGWTEERRRMAEPAEPTQVRPSSPPPAGPPTAGPPPPTMAPPRATGPTGPPTGPPSYGHVPSTGLGYPSNPSPGYPSNPNPGYPSNPNPGYPSNPNPGYGGYQPSPPKKSKLWLWLTLGVVLLLAVGTGVTLAVVAPWKDEDSAKTSKKTDPEPETDKVAVTGDLDGDGKGDAIYYLYHDYDNVKKVTATSDGEKFTLSEIAVDTYSEPNEAYFDWDSDGVNEKLTWKFVASGKQITLSSSDGDFPGEQTFTMSLASLEKYGDISIQVIHGDFDGDGDQDLAVAGPNDRLVDVSVMLNDGEGTFAAPVLWLSIPNAVIDATTVVAGDFDSDGDDDIWARLPSDKLKNKDYTKYYSGDRGYSLLTSNGKGFELGAINESSVYEDEYLVGDVTGDGTVNIIGVESDSYREQVTVTVYDVSTGRFKPIAGFTGTTKVGERSLQGAALSDVDGDGKADVVFAVKSYEESKFTGIQVMRSTGAVFEGATVWAETPVCEDDDCRIEFAKENR